MISIRAKTHLPNTNTLVSVSLLLPSPIYHCPNTTILMPTPQYQSSMIPLPIYHSRNTTSLTPTPQYQSSTISLPLPLPIYHCPNTNILTPTPSTNHQWYHYQYNTALTPLALHQHPSTNHQRYHYHYQYTTALIQISLHQHPNYINTLIPPTPMIQLTMASTLTLTISLSFRLAAVCNGVCPNELAMLASAPFSKRIFTHSHLSYLAAMWTGVTFIPSSKLAIKWTSTS